MDSSAKKILSAYKKQGPRIETKGRAALRSKKDFSLWYTPGVGVAASYLDTHPLDACLMSVKKNSVAVVSDGSAVLGLGNIGPYGALPVMEGKALIFKEMAGIDAWPIVLDTQDPEEIIKTVKAIAPAFGGINIEDIGAPKCFDIEKRLIEELDIPVMHDDQHGTAIIVLAGLMNAAKVVKKDLKTLRVVIIGAGAAGIATAKLLLKYGIKDVIATDSKGIVSKERANLNPYKRAVAEAGNPRNVSGPYQNALVGADVVIGLSGGGKIEKADVKVMGSDAVVFALANPIPEIMPDAAKAAGAAIVATGRSDFPNQLNNALVYPGIFRGALDKKVKRITDETKLRAAKALASLVPKPIAACIIPDLLDSRVVKTVAKAVR